MIDLIPIECMLNLISVHCILVGALHGRLQINWKSILLLAVTVGGTLAAYFALSGIAAEIIYVVCSLLYYFVPFASVSGHSKKRILIVTLMITGLTSTVTHSIAWITHVASAPGEVKTALVILTNALVTAVCALIGRKKLLKSLHMQIQFLSRDVKLIILIITWFSAVLSLIFPVTFAAIPESRAVTIVQLFTALLLISTGILCPLLITNNIASTYNDRLSKSIGQGMSRQAEHYLQRLEADEDLRMFKHDFKNASTALLLRLERGDIDGAVDFLKEHRAKLGQLEADFRTWNSVLDALLTEKNHRASTIGATIEFSGNAAAPEVDPVDLCILFGNAIDNALDACEKLPQGERRYVSIEARTTESDILYVQITNPVHHDVKIASNIVQTTKDDPSQHGCGLVTMHDVAERYNGALTISCENRVFCARFGLLVRQPSVTHPPSPAPKSRDRVTSGT